MLRYLFLFILLGSGLQIHAQQEDDTGNWIMYFGTNRVSDDWSIHSEVQYRAYDVGLSDLEQLLLRTGANYHLNENTLLTLGYGRIINEFLDEDAETVSENRIFQQLITRQNIGRIGLEHRYRVEQRWIEGDYRNRFRYRLFAALPLNSKTMEEGTVFLSGYDEIFVNTEETFFDRNRAYVAGGYQFGPGRNIQVGYLRQRVNSFGKGILNVGLTYNLDFRQD